MAEGQEFDDLQWLEPLRQKTREIEAETKAMRALNQLYKDNDKAMKTLAAMKELPDDKHLRILWQVAVTSAIEGQGEAYAIFAKMLYWELTGTGPQIKLDEPITKEEYHASKHPGDS